MEIQVSHLTREEVAARGRCSRDKVDHAIRSKELVAVKLGRRVLVTCESVDRWLAGAAPPRQLAPGTSG